MSRPLRVEYPNACYHVMNRGDDRRSVFTVPEDYTLFLEKLGVISGGRQFGIRLKKLKNKLDNVKC